MRNAIANLSRPEISDSRHERTIYGRSLTGPRVFVPVIACNLATSKRREYEKKKKRKKKRRKRRKREAAKSLSALRTKREKRA